MGCLGWVLIISGVIGIPFTFGGSIVSIIIGIIVLSIGGNSNKTREAVEKSAYVQQQQINSTNKKEKWIAQRMNDLIGEGLSIADAKSKAEMEYTINNE